MQPYTKCLVVQNLLQELKRSSAGASLLWAIAALVVVGGLGAAVAVMSPSTVQSKLEQEAAMRAYYNANSGLNFIYSIERTSEAGGVPYANFLNAVNSGNVVTYPLADGGDFSFQINSLNTNGNNGNYAIDSLVGTVEDASGGKRYSYVIYGGGKGSSTAKTYKPNVIENTKFDDSVIISNGQVSVAGSNNTSQSVVGDIQAGSITVKQMKITGDIYSKGATSISEDTAKVEGNICSDGDVNIYNAATVEGSVKSNGKITLGSGNDSKFTTVSGGLYSSKNVSDGSMTVSMGPHGYVGGDINANGSIILKYRSFVIGSAFAKNGIVLTGGGDAATSASIKTSAYASAYFDQGIGSKTSIALCSSYPGDKGGGKCSIGKDANAFGDIVLYDASKITGEVKKFLPVAEIKQPSGLSFDCSKYVSVPKMTSFDNPSQLPGMTSTKVKKFSGYNPIDPGWYGEFNYTGAIKFTSGTYYFDKLTIGYGSSVTLDITGGDILIFVKGEAKIGNQGGGLKVIDSKGTHSWKDADIVGAASVYLEAHDNISVPYQMGWFGTLLSTKSVTVNNECYMVGVCATTVDPSVVPPITPSVTLQWGSEIKYVQSHYAKKYW